jgi:acetyl esterase
MLVLYDADCGFCTRTALLLRRLDRRHRLELMALQASPGRLSDAPPMDQLLAAMHVREATGRWSVGGAAWVRICDEVAPLRPLGVLARTPGIRSLVEPTYAWVAAHRGRIGHLLGDDACRLDAPDAIHPAHRVDP